MPALRQGLPQYHHLCSTNSFPGGESARDWHARPDRHHFAGSDQGLAHFQLGSALGQDPSPFLVQAPPTHKSRFFRPNQKGFDDQLPRASPRRASPFLEEAGLLKG